MLDDIIRREGGYTDNPNDRGKATNFGITMATLAAWRGAPVTEVDVSLLTESEARSIYIKRYFQDPGFDKVLGEDLQAILLDSAVNHGPKQAVKLLQRALGVNDDGKLGPVSLAAVPHIDQRRMVLKVLAQRVRLYGSIITHDPSQAVFAKGWSSRVAELIEGVA